VVLAMQKVKTLQFKGYGGGGGEKTRSTATLQRKVELKKAFSSLSTLWMWGEFINAVCNAWVFTFRSKFFMSHLTVDGFSKVGINKR